MVRIISCLFGLALLAGCALGDELIPVSYVAPANLAVADGAATVTVTVNSQDGRAANRDRIGSKKNGYGMETARIMASNDVVELVRMAVERELESLGFKTGAQGIAVNVELQTFYNDFKSSFFKLDAVAEVAFNLTAKMPNGAFVYARSYKGIGMNQNLAIALPSTAQPALQQALQNAMAQVVQDENLQQALVAAGRNLPLVPQVAAAPAIPVALVQQSSAASSDPVAAAPRRVAVTAPAAPRAPLRSVEFVAPPVGTRIYRDNGAHYEVTAVNGRTVTTVTGSARRENDWVGLLFVPGDVSQRFPRDQIESLWPLEVGKSVTFDLSGISSTNGSGIWQITMSVLRQEELKIDAGTFQTMVVEIRERGLGGNDVSAVITRWFAPDLGFIIRNEAYAERGSMRPVYWNVTRVTRPKS